MKTLIQLYNKYSGTDSTEIRKFIKAKLDELGVKYKEYEGNIYNFNTAPLVSAHMDQVTTSGQAVHFYKQGSKIVGYNSNNERTNLGADDKNGVWIILKLLEEKIPISFCISDKEESGCLGISSMASKGLLNKIQSPYGIVCDRRGFKEILEKGGQGNYCFSLARNLVAFLNKGYTIGSGSSSDTGVLADYLECVNISVGYYEAHTKTEYTNIDELNETYEDVKRIITGYTHMYPATKEMYRDVYNYKKERSCWPAYG